MMHGDTTRSNPTVLVPPWDILLDDPTANTASPFPLTTVSVTSPTGDTTIDALTALHRYLPSNTSDFEIDDDCDSPVDAFSCDHFRMYEFKVRKCVRGRTHDWTECPYAHPGEKARRRDPRRYHYSGTPCPEFRKGCCKKTESCEFAHGVFECWLHPSRYRTQPCKDGTHCRRPICFFAHTPEQLRVLPHTAESYDRSPSRPGHDSYTASGSFGSSPTSTLYSPPLSPPSDSPPMSPLGANSVSELAFSMRNLHIGNFGTSLSPHAWSVQMGSGFCSPRSPISLRPGFFSLPSTPTRILTRSGLSPFDLRDKTPGEEEPVLERVESGRGLRARMYAKLSKENSLDRVDSEAPGPDVGWVSELVM
ncbi:hypothetical protein RHMOL_Rhmol07G0169000 [Rhododendron molle]|uniref:Uncharacterized protein n=1 Tax=Rhododendron molle TaxID=49168 RepID=A0ACC0N1S0_RHOML|nr:hypothetical protein RHMOL_Rhmol07G0169000 [Rhododendron molle]